MMLSKTISNQRPQASIGAFCKPDALVWPLWLEDRCQAPNVEFVRGDLFATRNPLKSHAERNVLSPFGNIQCRNVQVVCAFKAGDCRRALALEFCRRLASWQRLVQSGFNEVRFRASRTLVRRTSQKPPDSQMSVVLIQGGERRRFAMV